MNGFKSDAQVRQVLKRLEAEQSAIAERRDRLRDILSTVDELISDCDDAFDGLQDAIDAIERAADTLSKSQ